MIANEVEITVSRHTALFKPGSRFRARAIDTKSYIVTAQVVDDRRIPVSPLCIFLVADRDFQREDIRELSSEGHF
jgi:hypothetical protein